MERARDREGEGGRGRERERKSRERKSARVRKRERDGERESAGLEGWIASLDDGQDIRRINYRYGWIPPEGLMGYPLTYYSTTLGVVRFVGLAVKQSSVKQLSEIAAQK